MRDYKHLKKYNINCLVVVNITRANGRTEEIEYPYIDKTSALRDIPNHYWFVIHKAKANGGDITESCLADDHAWVSNTFGDHIEFKVYEL